MPVFFQQQINEDTRLGIWKIEEPESYFSSQVPQHRSVTHPHKRLQHLAGRFLLRYLFADFPIGLIRIADTRKPYLEGEAFHFSISHAGDYAAALVSRTSRVGADIEVPGEKVLRVRGKFLGEGEMEAVGNRQWAIGNPPTLKLRRTSGQSPSAEATADKWAIGNPPPLKLRRTSGQSAYAEAAADKWAMGKESAMERTALFWSAKESVFKWYGRGQVDFRRDIRLDWNETGLICDFRPAEIRLPVRYILFDDLVLTWVMTAGSAT